MREDDDPQSDQAEGSLADGLGQTPGDASSASDAYGDDGLDDGAYGDGAEDSSPVEGIGFLLDELHDAVFGEDDEGAAPDLAPDPADLASGTDLDLTGDGVIDAADLHEAESPFDFDVDGLHDGHHGHDGGVIDA